MKSYKQFGKVDFRDKNWGFWNKGQVFFFNKGDLFFQEIKVL